MNIFRRLALSLLVGGLLLSGARAQQTEQVALVVEVTRHGSRAPLQKSFDDSWTKGLAFGELTPVGQRQHFLLGKELAATYPSIFIGKLRPDEFYVRTSGIQRTVASAISHLMGVWNHFDQTSLPFSNGDNRVEPPGISHDTKNISFTTPLPNGLLVSPVHAEAPEEDFLLRPFTADTCPGKYQSAVGFKADMASRLDSDQSFKDLVKEAFTKFGVEWDGKNAYRNCVDLGDFVLQDYLNNPSAKITPEDPLFSKLARCYEYDISGVHTDKEMNKALVTPLFRELLAKMDAKVKKPNSPLKFLYFSAHDSNLAAVLASLQQLDPQCIKDDLLAKSAQGKCGTFPTVASNLIFELVSFKDEFFVRGRYNFEPFDLCGLKNPADQFRCPVAAFGSMLQAKLHPHWESFCGFKTRAIPNPVIREDNAAAADFYRAFAIIVLFVNAFLLIGFLFMIVNRMQTDSSPPGKQATDKETKLDTSLGS
jgi:lysosomal acid phosphatase